MLIIVELLRENIINTVEIDKELFPACRDEARAWKFTTKALRTKRRTGGKYNNYKLAYTICNMSVKKLANGFKNEMTNWIYGNNKEHFTIYSESGGGLYKRLQLK